MKAGKSSAVAAVASELGCDEAHTGAAGENSAQPDLLRAFDDELALFEDQPIRPPQKRGPGRPPGSVNRTTLQLQRFLQARGYRDPAEFLASLVTSSTADLARVLGVEDRIEVLKLQRQAASDLMPYFHQRQGPVEPARTPEARPLVMIFEGTMRAVDGAGAGALSIHDVEPNQRLIEGDPLASHDDASHDKG